MSERQAPGTGAGRVFDGLLWVGIALGVLARLLRYADGRSLWGDEAALALNVVGRSATELFEPLDFGQSAPYGFLLLTRACAVLFGPQEASLRLVPLLASLAALPLFASLARRLLEPRAAHVALFLMATSEPLVYYASEFKQYSSDVLVALAVLRLGWWARSEGDTSAAIESAAYAAGAAAATGPAGAAGSPEPLRSDAASAMLAAPRVAALAVGGALAMWCSHPAVFVCASTGVVLAAEAWRRRGPGALAPLGAVALVWGASFGVLYASQLGAATADPYLAGFWADAYAPFPPLTRAEWLWYPQRALGFFDDPVGLPPAALSLGLAALGAGVGLGRDRRALGWLGGPLVVALLASMAEAFPLRTATGFDIRARIYPFEARLWLFAVPLVLAAVARGVAALAGRFGGGRGAVGAWAAALAAVSAVSLWQLGVGLLDPPRVQELRPVLERMREELREGDVAWVQRGSELVFEYYARRMALPLAARNVGAATPESAVELEAAVAALAAGQRVWFVALSHPAWGAEADAARVEEQLARRARAGPAIAAPAARARPWTVER